MAKYDYEIIDIRPSAGTLKLSGTWYVESDWMVCVDGINKVAHEFNRETGRDRPYDYEKAIVEMFHDEQVRTDGRLVR